MKKINTLIVCSTTICLFEGCISSNEYLLLNPKKYFQSQNYQTIMPFNMQGGNISAPSFAEKKDFNVSLDLTKGGGDLRLSYAVSNRFGLMVNGSYFSISQTGDSTMTNVPTYTGPETNEPDTLKPNGSTYGNYNKTMSCIQKYIEMAAVYYIPFGKTGRWEAIAGGSFGNTATTYNYSSLNLQGKIMWNLLPYFYGAPLNANFSEKRNYGEGFLQSDLGYSTKHTEGSISARLSIIDYSSQQFQSDYSINQYPMAKFNLVFEPALHFGYGWKHFRLYTEYGRAIDISSSDVHWSGTYRIGISLKF